MCLCIMRLSHVIINETKNINSCMRQSHCETCLIIGLNSLIIDTFTL